MLFKDYFDLMKKYYKKTPSDPDLCMDLFNSVIENIENDDRFYDYDKSAVSRILKGQRRVPSIVRDHIYDDSVEEGIAAYFDDYIIPKLIPNHSDLIHELIAVLNNYSNISKPHLSTLKSLAKENALGTFLAEVFRFAVIEGTGINHEEYDTSELTITTVDSSKKPSLSLCGISKNNSLIDAFIIEKLSEKTNVSREIFREKLRAQYDEVSNMHLSSEYSPVIINGTNLSFNKKTEIVADTQKTIKQVAEILKIEMSADFFELGGLATNTFATAALMGGGVDLKGTSEEKHKYDLIYKIEDTINNFAKAIPFIDEFENIKFVRLAIKNSGTMHDENISISLSFDKGTLLTIKEIADMGKDVYDYIMYECDHQKHFGIERGLDYLDFESSIKTFKPESISLPPIPNPFGYIADASDSINKEDELAEYFDYYIAYQDERDIVKVSIEEIIHNEAVAFPSILLLKKDVDCIEYTIHSKYTSEKVTGKIVVSK